MLRTVTPEVVAMQNGPMWAVLRLFGGRQEAQLEQKILRLTRNNRGAMERAATAKRQKHPVASRAQLLQMVHDDYVRDYSR
ncbi:hypothetical protein [Deinococcus hohokamensis]|uniref:Transposase n=1 Tax=Deinococcus hohokamensis TaxID=309883 RepID=A0ABV9I9E8_9DEIO